MEKLSSKNRILRTLAGNPVDRVPIWPPIPWHPLSPDPEPGNWKTSPRYQQLIPLVSENCDFLVQLMIPEANQRASTVESPGQRAVYGGIFDRRFFLIPPDQIESRIETCANGDQLFHYYLHTSQGDLHSQEIIRHGIDTIWEGEPLVKTLDDAEKLLSIPYHFHEPNMSAYMADVARLGDRGIPVIVVTSPMVMVSHVTGFQRFLEWSISEPTHVERLIEVAFERIVERLDFVLKSGVDAIYRFGGAEQATPPLMSKHAFKRFILGYEKPLWQMVRRAGQIVWVHCHGKVSSVLEDFIEGGVQLLDPVEPLPQGDIGIGDAKRRAAKGPMTLVGNIEISDLLQKTPDEIEALVKQAICEGGRQHFILSASDWVISEMDDLACDNVIRFVEAGVKYGTFANSDSPCC